MAAKFVNIARDTPMLLPPDLRDWVAEDDLVHFVIEATETEFIDLEIPTTEGKRFYRFTESL